MRAILQITGSVSGVLLAVTLGIGIGEYLLARDKSDPSDSADGELIERLASELPRPDVERAGYLAASGAVEQTGRGSEQPAEGEEPGGDGPVEADGGAERGESEAGEPQEPAASSPPLEEPEMAWEARVVAACESGKRLAGGTPKLGSHRWHISPHRYSTASGAFQFLDATWRRVAREIGASHYPRAKDAPPAVQLEAFRWLWWRDRSAWDASRSCWEPLLRRTVRR